MKVSDILKAKGSRVVTIRPHETVATLARKLKLEKIGAIVVSEDGASPEGIVTERDIVNGLVAHGADVLAMPVGQLMTRSVATCAPDDGVKEVMAVMTHRRTRYLLVTDGGQFKGIVSIGDVVKNRLEDAELEANVLRDYITAR
jgi:CBS domain-containing protein